MSHQLTIVVALCGVGAILTTAGTIARFIDKNAAEQEYETSASIVQKAYLCEDEYTKKLGPDANIGVVRDICLERIKAEVLKVQNE